MKWDTVAFRFTCRQDEVDSMLIECVGGSADQHAALVGPGMPHEVLLAVLREEGWEPFSVQSGKGTDSDSATLWTDRWFKRQAV